MSFYYPLPARLQCLYVSCDTAKVGKVFDSAKEKR